MSASLPTPYYDRDGITLYCGDCRDILPLLDAGSVDLVLTDPPYGVGWQSGKRIATPRFAVIEGDDAVDTNWLWSIPPLVRDGGAAYICTRWDVYPQWRAAVADVLSVRNCIVWAKEGGGIGDLQGNYWNEYELLIYATKGRHLLRGKRQSNVWRVDSDPPASYRHPTQKPVALMMRAIEKSSAPGDLILDPFGGSGTTARACKDLGRRCILIEREERYCALTVQRLAQAVLPLGAIA